MKTTHHIYFENSKNMRTVPSESVGLVVTSPPYPMIEMWDEIFVGMNPRIREALDKHQGLSAFELMNRELEPVWDEVYRVLKFGGFACINIGDATRTVGNDFMLYPSHARILSYLIKIGFSPLPAIIWRKQTNAPNKFMGSGMLPAGAYVTLEHEYILVLRKGAKRVFNSSADKLLRRESSFFWEERNTWFSDVWMDIKGTTQNRHKNNKGRRPGAFPFEVPYRLVNMYSTKGDTVLDPFLGSGTSMLAAMAACRNSVGFELAPDFRDAIVSRLQDMVEISNERIRNRIENHIRFVKERFKTKGRFKHQNTPYQFPVVTAQERDLFFNHPVSVNETGNNVFEVEYTNAPGEEYRRDWKGFFQKEKGKKVPRASVHRSQQKELFD